MEPDEMTLSALHACHLAQAVTGVLDIKAKIGDPW